MRQQKCADSKRFCDACNGFGYVAQAPNLPSMAETEALIAAGFGDKLIEVVEVECKRCGGTGCRAFSKSTDSR